MTIWSPVGLDFHLTISILNNKMDLSSLEGPPIHNPRITISLSPNYNIPRRPVPTPSQGCEHAPCRRRPTPTPPRPVSVDSRGRCQDEERDARARLSVPPLRITRPKSADGRDTRFAQSDHLHPSGHNRNRFYRDPQPQLRNTRVRDTLVWMERQRVWVASNRAPRLPQSQCQSQSRPRSHSDSPRSQTNINGLIGNDELPPSYENHYSDRVVHVTDAGLVPVPAVAGRGRVSSQDRLRWVVRPGE